MSEHTVEDVVADSIRLLHEQDERDDHRDLFGALLRLQADHDCGFTHGRFLDALVARGYTAILPMSAHPGYARRRAAFETFAGESRDITFVGSEILRRRVRADERAIGHEHGYLVDGRLHCDAGTPLFDQLVAAGALTGDLARPLRDVFVGSAALGVCRLAEATGDHELIAYWLAFGPRSLFPRKEWVTKGTVLGTNPFSGKKVIAPRDYERTREPTPDELEGDADAVALRDLGRRVGVASIELHDDLRAPEEHRTDAERWLWSER